MRERLDPTSPIPLYWQVAEALRYRVATGELTPGERLPSLRDAAKEWGINMHTVRRAYSKLAEGGIVRVRPRSGTVVLEPPDGPGGAAPVDSRHDAGSRRPGWATPPGVDWASGDHSNAAPDDDREFDAWLREVARRGKERWGLGAGELGAALAEIPSTEPDGARVLVVECSESQSTDLARQLSDRWRVTAEPWSLEREGDPPDEAVLLGTYFHYNDLRVRWPRRFPAVRFVATRPDDRIRERLEALRRGRDEHGPLAVVLWEWDETMARNIAADLVRILPEDEFTVRQEVVAPESVGNLPPGPALFSPRAWAALPKDARRRGDFMEVRYVFDRGELDRVARHLGWEEQ